MTVTGSLTRSRSSGPSDTLLELGVGLRLRDGAREIADTLTKEQERAQRAAREREERAERQAAEQSKKRAEELIKRRRRLAIEAIKDETQRRRAAIQAEYQDERRSIDALMRDRLRAGETTAAAYKRQMLAVERDLAAVRDRRLAEVPTTVLQGRAGRLLAAGGDYLGGRAGTAGLIASQAGVGTAGLAALGAGAALTAGLTKALALASSFEDQLVEVRKTTGLTDTDLERLGAGLLDLAGQTGIAQNELAAIAAVAGQLGIQGQEDLLAFTATVARFSAVTELSAEEAATALATTGRAFGLPIEAMERLGSAANELSNTTAAKAGDIINALQRVGAAGVALGLSADQVAAFAATLIDAGIDTERAGTSLRSVFTLLVTKAGEVAGQIGLTEQAFRDMISQDAIGALTLYLRKLGEMNPQLRQINIESVFGQENVLQVSTLATQVGDLNRNLEVSGDAFRDGTSLSREFETSLDALSAQWNIFTARLTEAATGIGQDMLPATTDLVRSLNALVAETRDEAQEIGGLTAALRDILEVLDALGQMLSILETYAEGSGTALRERLLAAAAAASDGLADLFGGLSRVAPGLGSVERGAQDAAYSFREMQGAANVDLSRLRAELDSVTEAARAGVTEMEAWARVHAETLGAGGPGVLLSGRGGPRFRPRASAPEDSGYTVPPDEEAARLEERARQRAERARLRAERKARTDAEKAERERERQMDAFEAFNDRIAQLTAERTDDEQERALAALRVRTAQERDRIEELKRAALDGQALTAEQRRQVETQASEAIRQLAVIEQRDIRRLRVQETTERLRDERAVADARAQLREANRAADVAAIADPHERRRAQIESEYRQRLDALRRERVFEEQQIDASTDTEEEKARQRHVLNLRLTAELRQADTERILSTAELQRDVDEDAKRRATDADRVARERADRRLQELRRYTDALVDSILGATSVQQELGEAQIAWQRVQYSEEERALQDSLARREITQIEFAARMEALAQSRSDFETQLERDRAGFFERSARGVLEVVKATLREELSEVAKAELAKLLLHTSTEKGKSAATLAGTATRAGALALEAGEAVLNASANIASAIATQIKQVVSSIPFPFNLAAIPLGVGAVVGAYAGARKLFFAEGGFVGQPGERGRDEVPVIVGLGEAILNHHQQAVVDDSLRRTGRGGLGNLFRDVRTPHSAGPQRYATGGYAGFAPLLSVPSAGVQRSVDVGAAADMTPVARGLAELADRIDRQTDRLASEQRGAATRITGTFASPHAARRARQLADDQVQRTDPRRGRR